MKTRPMEPGLLSVFRLFAGLRFGMLVLGLVSRLWVHSLPEQAPTLLIVVSSASAGLLLLYLSLPVLQRVLAGAYLPVGLLIATLGPLLEQNQVLRMQIERGLFAQLVGSWQLIPLLFIPLVLIGWQYNFRTVLLFCFGTAFLDWVLIFSAVGGMNPFMFPLIGVNFVRTVSFITVGFMVVRLMSTQREQRTALADANTRLAHYASTLEQLATTRERNRLAREMHDTLAHSLSGVAVQLEAVKSLWSSNPDDAQQMLERSLATTRSGLTETRRALQALRASPIEDMGLSLALNSLGTAFAARSGLELELQIPDQIENLSPDVEQCIYRITQEALENVARHAQARHVNLRVHQEQNQLSLSISDDGRGFNLEDINAIEQFGLRGMRERAESVGGQFEIDSHPGSGTTIRLVWGDAL